jgi:hypothetical protein
MKDKFLEDISKLKPDDIRRFISSSGKDPKLIEPIIDLDKDLRYIMKEEEK